MAGIRSLQNGSSVYTAHSFLLCGMTRFRGAPIPDLY